MHNSKSSGRSRSKAWHIASAAMAGLAVTVILMPGGVIAQQEVLQSTSDPDAALAYWTPERMQAAIPKEMPSAVRVPGEVSVPSQLPPDARPGYSPGWFPGVSGDPTAVIELSPQDALMMGADQPQTTPPFVPPGTPTDFINYAPFQRYTHFGNYLTYPMSTVGKLFFNQAGGSFVCSASVIARNTIATAGHCVSNGSGVFSSAFVFCPSYFAGTGSGAPHPSRGCWAGVNAATSSAWHFAGNIDRDYGCIITSPTGGVPGAPVGTVTGSTGRAWNWPTRQATFAFGYPQAPPFPGYHIINTTSTEWYQLDRSGAGEGATNHLSKYIGSDQTGGSSGGPWWLNFRHPTTEYADTDGSALTDPAQGACCPWINGINSHKRCTTAGCPAGTIFTQEMGSPQFLNSTPDGGESEDVFALCFANGGA